MNVSASRTVANFGAATAARGILVKAPPGNIAWSGVNDSSVLRTWPHDGLPSTLAALSARFPTGVMLATNAANDVPASTIPCESAATMRSNSACPRVRFSRLRSSAARTGSDSEAGIRESASAGCCLLAAHDAQPGQRAAQLLQLARQRLAAGLGRLRLPAREEFGEHGRDARRHHIAQDVQHRLLERVADGRPNGLRLGEERIEDAAGLLLQRLEDGGVLALNQMPGLRRAARLLNIDLAGRAFLERVLLVLAQLPDAAADLVLARVVEDALGEHGALRRVDVGLGAPVDLLEFDGGPLPDGVHLDAGLASALRQLVAQRVRIDGFELGESDVPALLNRRFLVAELRILPLRVQLEGLSS